MQIYRARENVTISYKYASHNDKCYVDLAKKAVYKIGDFQLEKGKAYAVYDSDPYSGGYFEVAIVADWRPIYVKMNDAELHKYFTIDLALSAQVNTRK